MKHLGLTLMLSLLALSAIGTGILALAHGKGQVKLNETLSAEFERQQQAAEDFIANGRYNLAEQSARQLCSIAPDHPSAILAMIGALCGQKRYREALPYCEKIIDRFPRDASYRIHHALVLLKLEKTDEALEELDQAWKISPGSIFVNLKLAEIYDEMWRFDQAARHRFLASLLNGIAEHPGEAHTP
ncbi:MAG: CDC27 family protein [Victivallaceae bacterium]|nr:CDC27 family protein [Victivallaceae bacterium]